VPDLNVTLDDGALRLTLNRPDRGNAITPKMADDLAVLLEDVAPATDVRIVVLTGIGEHFCLGVDPLPLGRPISSQADLLINQTLNGSSDSGALPPSARITRAITRLEKPVLTALNGPAAGLGCAIAFAGDLIIAEETAYFQLTPDGTGDLPDGGLTATLSASLGRHRAMRMALLGDSLSAVQAYDAGLVAAVVRPEHFTSSVERIIRRIAAGPASRFAQTKRAVNAATLGGLNQALTREARARVAVNGVIPIVRPVPESR
jgi:enoyl-CoA hydratase